MITIEDVTESRKRIEDLKQSTILRYSENINYNNEVELYHALISHLVKGDFDDVFYSSYLENVDKDERKDVMNLVKEYSNLCFHDGNYEYWTDSIMTLPLLDLDYICTKILDNYNFLVLIALRGGRDALELIKSFSSNPDYNSSSVIDYLRSSFIDDSILEKILVDMSSKDSLFNIFNNYEKSMLCSVPTGVLYFFDNDSIDFSSPILLAKEIYRRETGEDSDDFKEIINHFREDYDFENVLIDIQSDALSDSDKYKSIFVEKYKKLNKKKKNDE